MGKVVKRFVDLTIQGTASPLTAANRLLDLDIGGLPSLTPLGEKFIPDPNAPGPALPELPPTPGPVGTAPTSPRGTGALQQERERTTPTQRARRASGRLRGQGGRRRRQTLLTGALGSAQSPSGGGGLSNLLGN